VYCTQACFPWIEYSSRVRWGAAEIVNKEVTLVDGPNSLFHEGGTAIVIHASPDDNMTDPSG